MYGSEYIITDIKVSEDGAGLILSFRDENISDKEIKLIDLLTKASNKSAGLMSSQDKINLDEISNAFKIGELTPKIKGVVENEKALYLDADGNIGTNLSLDYYTDDNGVPYIRIIGNNNFVVGSPLNASRFIKDGMISSVDVVKRNGGTFIEMVFNTDSGITEPKYIDVTDIFTIYDAGDGIAIEEGVIKVKINPSDKYLTVDSTGVRTKGIDEAISAIKSVIIGSEEDSEDSQTIYGVKKYVNSVITSTVKVKDVDSTASNGVNLSLNDGVIKVIVDAPTLSSEITKNVSGNVIKIGEPIIVGETELISASASVTSAIKTLENQIQESLTVKTFSITGDDYISVDGTSTDKKLVTNVEKIASAMVDNSSAIKVENGKLYIRWENL